MPRLGASASERDRMRRQARYEQRHAGLLDAGVTVRPAPIESVVSGSLLLTL
jgi:hypothetical protein